MLLLVVILFTAELYARTNIFNKTLIFLSFRKTWKNYKNLYFLILFFMWFKTVFRSKRMEPVQGIKITLIFYAIPLNNAGNFYYFTAR